jgi:diacylglycerol kinase (ATP)
VKAFIIYNPAAGQRQQIEDLHHLVEFLIHRGWEMAGFEQTHGRGDATTFARRAVALGCDVVFAAGGDGTVSQVVDGLVNQDIALAILPSGTGNVMARQLGLPIASGLRPHALLEAAQMLLEGRVRPVDVGQMKLAGGRVVHHFLCWGGVGFDAQVTQNVNKELERKHRLGMLAFVVAGLLTLRDYAGTSAIVRADGRRVTRRLIMLVANNIQLYGVFFKMAPRAVLDDGLFDIYCFRGRGAGRTLLHGLRILFNRHFVSPEVDAFRARRVEVRTARPLPVHVDGEPIGHTPVVIEVLPRAVKLVVPHSAPATLFSDRDDTEIAEDAEETAWQRMARLAKEAGR